MKIERVVVTGGREFNDYARIDADLRALVPFGLRRVAQGGNGVRKPRHLGARPWLFLDGAAWALTADAVKPGHSADAIAWHVACSYVAGQKEPGIKEVATYFAQWEELGRRAAGPIRNVEMLDAERPDLVPAYPDRKSVGTWHCVREALRRGVLCLVWAPWIRGTEELLQAIGAGPRWNVTKVGERWAVGPNLPYLAPDPDGRRFITETMGLMEAMRR